MRNTLKSSPMETCGSEDEETISSTSSDSENSSENELNNTSTTTRKNIPDYSLKRPRSTAEPLEKLQVPMKKKSSSKDLRKPPTVEEMNRLRETENLFHSNLFRLQAEEMLSELKVKTKYSNYIQEYVKKLNEFLENNVSDMEEKVFTDNLSWLQGSKIIVPLNLSHLKRKTAQFRFEKSTEMPLAYIIGSAANGTIIFHNTELIVDICIKIPREYFQKDDYLNVSYDEKRLLYLIYILKKMIDENFIENEQEVNFNYFRNNPYKTILEIVTKRSENESKIVKFRIFTSAEENTFKLNRFVPWNSNIRETIFNKKAAKNYKDDNEEIPLATPHYNANILFDLTMRRNQEYADQMLIQQKNLREGLILLKVWLKQRNLDVIGYSGFGNHLLTMYVVYLYKERKLHNLMSSYQIARNVWNYLALSELNEENKGITLCDNSTVTNRPTLEQFHAYYDVVFVDVTGFLNLSAFLSLDVYLKVKQEAKRTIELLNNKRVDSFNALFMTKIPPHLKFDHVLKINDFKCIKKVVEINSSKADKLNFIGEWYPQFLKLITGILRKGLGKRIRHLCPIEKNYNSWNIKEHPPVMENEFVLLLGIELNPEEAFEILDKGPQANNDTAAEAFRNFWGNKSELRRFKDGTISEACVWSSSVDSFAQRRLIVYDIIAHLLQHHFSIKSKQIDYIASNFDVTYQLCPSSFEIEDKKMNDAESTALSVMRTFDELSKILRDMSDLPLDIHSIQGISAVFRYCDPVPILNTANAYFGARQDRLIFQSYTTNEAAIELSISGKWPNELKAFRCIKTAFYLKVVKFLRERHNLQCRAEVDGILCLKNGYLFKFGIYHSKETILLKRTTFENGAYNSVDTAESIQLEKRFNLIPKITSSLHALYQRFPSFGPCVMIAKRWLYSQLIDSFLWPDECTELLLASQYLEDGAFSNPCQPQMGFFRFLHLLVNTDFKTKMFLLNFNEEISEENVTELEKNFMQDREKFPPLCIITSYDNQFQSIWSKKAPTVHLLARVKLLAKTLLEYVEPTFLTSKKLIVDGFLKPSLEGYDVIIHLCPNNVRKCLAYNFKPLKKKETNVPIEIPLADFDPVQKGLQELRDAFDDYVIFFYDPCGGEIITGILKPTVFVKNDFKVGNINGPIIVKKEKLVFDLRQFIEDVKIILRELYVCIECPKLDTAKSE